jgi:hypothetical protein
MSGLRNIKKTLKEFPSKEYEIYFHQDLDGVTSALGLISYLAKYDFKCLDAHVIQYGNKEFNINKPIEGRLAVLCDFAHSKPLFTIATDHHQTQAGFEHSKVTDFTPARSNCKTISENIGNNIFENIDIELINTIDSADFLEFNIKPDDISNSLWTEKDRFSLGLVVNRLLLAYKNKSISGGIYKNKNFLECLVLDSKPSIISIYNNIYKYVKDYTTLVYDKRDRLFTTGNLATFEELDTNVKKYQETMKTYNGLYIRETKGKKIAVQFDGGDMYEPGSYDRYTIFKNNPDIDYFAMRWSMGLIQVAQNPFKENSNVNLGEIADELLEQYKPIISRAFIDILSIKKEAELGIAKDRYNNVDTKDRIGFTGYDLEAFYGDKIYLDRTNKFTITDEFRSICNKPFATLTKEDKIELRKYKVSWYDIVRENSGGHFSITNISSFNYFQYLHVDVKKYVAKFFNVNERRGMYGTYFSELDIMKSINRQFIKKLEERI